MNRVIPALLTCIFALTNSAASTAVATIQLSPNHVLPRLLPMMTVSVTNAGGTPLHLTGMAAMRVIRSDGTAFIPNSGADFDLGQVPFAPADDPLLVVPAGVTHIFYYRGGVIVPDPFHRAEFFADRRFRKPGRYLVSLQLLTTDAALAIITSDVSFTVDEPSGSDAAVWALLLPAIDSSTPIEAERAVTLTALAQYSDSRYLPHLLQTFHASNDQATERLALFALRQAGSEALATEWQIILLRFYAQRAFQRILEFDARAALAYRNKAYDMAMQLKDSRYLYAVDEVKTVLDELATPDQVQLQLEWRLKSIPSSPLLIKPFVQCVDPGLSASDPLIVVFGYDSPNVAGKYVPRGAANRLRPEGTVASLPNFLAQGHREKQVIAVAKHGAEVAWTLDGSTAEVSPSSPRCPQPAAPALVVPFLDCARGGDDERSATFGYINPNADPVRVPVGPANSTTGTAAPPTVFLPGEHSGAFVVTSKKGVAPAWTLQGTTITASAKSVSCGSEDDQQGEH